jgi:hypothetical protein
MSRYQLAGAVAMMLVAVLMVTWLLFRSGEEETRIIQPRFETTPEPRRSTDGPTPSVPPPIPFRSWVYQGRLERDNDLSRLAHLHSPIRTPTRAFGFTALAGVRDLLHGRLSIC